LPAPQVVYKSTDKRQPDMLSLEKTKQTAPLVDNTLRNEFNQMRIELDSLKSVQQSAIAKRKADDVQANIKTQPASRLQSTAKEQEKENTRISALQQEVDNLRRDLEREKSSNNNLRRQSPDVVVRATPPKDNKQDLTTGYASSVPLVSERNYDKEGMKALREEVTSIQTELKKLRAQQQIEKDTLVDTRIDSLVKLINRIESLDRTSANNAVSPIASPYQKGSMLTEQLIDSLKMQVAGLNQSLVSMQAKFTEEIDSLATGIPLSALGSTVIYYNINAAELNSEDKQRLALLSQKLKSDQSVILHIKGFTDQTGNAASNLALSRKRAENVKNYFVSQIGIKPDQILINYFGQQKASSGKDNPYDRRVEIELFRQ
jgi:outer membrane protein OmpA-like peptidoglycan-associated protein